MNNRKSMLLLPASSFLQHYYLQKFSFQLEYHCSQSTRRILLCCLFGRVITETMTVWRDASDPLSQTHPITCTICMKIMNFGRKSSFMTGFLTFIQTVSHIYLQFRNTIAIATLVWKLSLQLQSCSSGSPYCERPQFWFSTSSLIPLYLTPYLSQSALFF